MQYCTIFTSTGIFTYGDFAINGIDSSDFDIWYSLDGAINGGDPTNSGPGFESFGNESPSSFFDFLTQDIDFSVRMVLSPGFYKKKN